MKKVLIALLAIVAFGAPLLAVQQQFVGDSTHEIGINANGDTYFRDPNAGNFTLNQLTNQMTPTITGKTVFQPASVIGISSTTVISATATYIVVTSTGGDVTCGLTFALPCLSTATATNGQYVVLGSTQGSNAVIFSSGAIAAMDLSSATRKVANGTVLTVIYDGAKQLWREVSFAAN